MVGVEKEQEIKFQNKKPITLPDNDLEVEPNIFSILIKN